MDDTVTVRRNITVLTAAQALGGSSAPIVMSLGGLVGQQLADNPAWVTLPVSLFGLGLAIGTLPAATQDLSLVVGADIPAARVADAVREGAGELLEDLRLVDDYRGQGVPEGAKSLTFALRFRAADRTLTAAEASEAKLAGAALAAERTGAAIRE